MVCPRCIKTVREEISKLKLEIIDIDLGFVEIEGTINENTLEEISESLKSNGFELIDKTTNKTVEKIKTLVIEIVHHGKETQGDEKISEIIATNLGYDYTYLSKLFSSTEKSTIEKYIIKQRLERVKELLSYGELSLKEISFKTGFSSAQHLSNQFKKNIGISPTKYKQQKNHSRKAIDKL